MKQEHEHDTISHLRKISFRQENKIRVYLWLYSEKYLDIKV